MKTTSPQKIQTKSREHQFLTAELESLTFQLRGGLVWVAFFLLICNFLLFTIVAEAATIGVPPNFIPGAGLSNGLVGWWTMDGKDTPWTSATAATTLDKSGNGNTGTLTNMAQATSPVVGKIGQGLKFDGVDDSISLVDNAALNLSTRTVSFWVKPTILSGIQFIISEKLASYSILFSNTNLQVYWKDGSSASKFTSVGIGSANVWKHIVIVFTVSGSNVTIDRYLNGVPLTPYSDANGFTTQGPYNNFGGGIYKLNGSLDDVRIYNRALSATEIRQLYNIGAATKQSASPPVTNTTGCSTGLSCGLVGYWTMDGADVRTNIADKSGQGNHGALVMGASGNVATSTMQKMGKIGQALSFDGGDDYVDVGNASGLQNVDIKTISFWTKISAQQTDGTGSHFINKNNVWFFSTDPGNNRWIYGQNFSISAGRWSIPQQNTNVWLFVTIVYNRTDTSNDPIIYVNGISQTVTEYLTPRGSASTDAGNTLRFSNSVGDGRWVQGVIDDVRIYNRALSATEIRQLYNIGASTKQSASPTVTNTTGCSSGLSCGLVGYWTMDGADVRTNIADKSGQGNHGALVMGASGNVATSSMQKMGKIGQALEFDGVNDYVNVGDMTVLEGSTYATWSFWLKPVNSDYDDVYLSKSSGWTISVPNSGLGAGANKLRVIIGGAASPVVYVNAGTFITNGVWQHFTIVYDGTQSTNTTKVKIYKNGVQTALVGSVGTIPTTLPATATNFNIGNSASSADGSLDDVRIYNRALSAGEITQLYNAGR